MKILLALLLTMTFALSSLIAEPPATARVAFAQSCFWTGEMQLGQIDGVMRTEAGFFQGHEVTLVDYDPARVSLEKLAAQARQADVADRLYLPAQTSARAGAVAGVAVVGRSTKAIAPPRPATRKSRSKARRSRG